MNDRDRWRPTVYVASMRQPLLSIAAILFLVAAAPPVASGSTWLCPATLGSTCKPVQLEEVSIAKGEAILLREVKLREGALPLDRPLMVRIVATASSEVSWNGTVIGRNGVPAAIAAQEKPGRFEAAFTVPAQLVRPGTNLVSVRMSAHHAWLPAKPVVRTLYIGPSQGQRLRGLWLYLPTLLLLGVLAAASIYFSATALSDRRDRGVLLLALIAGSAVLQLVLEVSRAFIDYSYHWYLARMAAIAVVAAATAVFIGAYGAHRLAPSWTKRIVVGVATAAAIIIFFAPWYDFKPLGFILAGATGLGICAYYALRSQRRAASIALSASLAFVAFTAWHGTGFLERDYFALLAALLMILIAEQVRNSRRIRLERDAERKRAEALAERLRLAEREGEPIIVVKTGTQAHRVAEGDVLYVQAADDYCEVVLASGRRLLVTMSLTRFLATMSPQFVRVHKSYGVNRAHVTGAKAKPGGGRNLVLSDQGTVPIGRSYGAAVAAWCGRGGEMRRQNSG